MIIKRKLFANITNNNSISAIKSIINQYAKKSSGIANKEISVSLKQAAKSVSSVTGDNVNGFIVDNSGNRIGNTIYTYIKKKPRKSSKNLWQGDLFNNLNLKKIAKKQKSITKSNKPSTGGNNILEKVRAKNTFNRKLKRNYQSEIGKDGLVTGKLTKTDGSSRVIMKNQGTLLTNPNFTKGTDLIVQ